MARPPEPLSVLLPYADMVFDGEVAAIEEERDDAPAIDAPVGHVDVGRLGGSQMVRLRVERMLRGEPADVLTAEKPIAPYVLWKGARGPFLLAHRDGRWVIIGRYGPLLREVAEVEAALSSIESAESDIEPGGEGRPVG